MLEVEFIYNGAKTLIKCQNNDKIKDIFNTFTINNDKEIKSLCIIYNSKIINEELMEKEFYEIANKEDKGRKKMNILVYDNINKEKEETKETK